MATRRGFLQAVGALSATMAWAANGRETVVTSKSGENVASATMPLGLTLLAIRQDDGSETLGVKLAAGVLDVVRANALSGQRAPTTLEALLHNGGADRLQALVRAADAAGKDSRLRGALLSEEGIVFGRLFTRPGKIVCVGLNYREHAEETGAAPPKQPILFNKYDNALAAHGAPLRLPPREVAYKFDYETELLIVIGRTARNVSRENALDYVAGYAVGHDFSARDLQLDTGGQWMVGKTLDGFAPIGPYFVSADLVGNPNDLKIETRVNGELRQSSSTRNFIFDTQALIAYTSRLFALEPGDLIFTGTPPGVILGMPAEKQVWLKAGDRIESTIEKLGTLRFDLA